MSIQDQIKAIVVKKPCIPLEEAEIGFFQTKCQYGEQVEQLVTTTKASPGIGIHIPIAGPFGIGIGSKKVKTTTKKETVWNRIPCTLLLTSNRMIIKSQTNAVQFDLDSFEDIKLHKDGITITSNGKPYYFFMNTKDVKKFAEIWGLVGEAARQGIKTEDLF